MKQTRPFYFFLGILILCNSCHRQVKSDTLKTDAESLQDLPIQHTYLRLEEALKDPDKVKWISFMSDGIDTVPLELLKFPNLQGIDLSYNNFVGLPKWIGQLKNLKEILLRKNKITSLPKEFFNLTNLENIDLWGNEMTEIPTEVNKLKRLKELNISANNLDKLPSSFSELDSLIFLSMEINQFKEIPAVICNMKNLKRLHLYNNKISDFPQAIINLTLLQELTLDGNIVSAQKIETLEQLMPNCRIVSDTHKL